MPNYIFILYILIYIADLRSALLRRYHWSLSTFDIPPFAGVRNIFPPLLNTLNPN